MSCLLYVSEPSARNTIRAKLLVTADVPLMVGRWRIPAQCRVGRESVLGW